MSKEKELVKVEGEVVDTTTGEIVKADDVKDVPQLPENQYNGIAQAPITPEETKKLLAPVDPNIVQIRPDGLIYVPGVYYRRRLTEIFGAGNWALRPLGVSIVNDVINYKGALYIRGHFVAEAIGEQKYVESNANMSYATAHEGAKTDCLVRCCKDLGMFTELWDPNFIEDWIDQYAVKVWCYNVKNPKQKKPFWRRKDQKPIDLWPWKEDTETIEDVEKEAKEWNKDEAVNKLLDNLITPPQQKLFWARARNKKWSEEAIRLLLDEFGYRSTTEIEKEKFDEILKILDDKTLRDQFEEKAKIKRDERNES